MNSQTVLGEIILKSHLQMSLSVLILPSIATFFKVKTVTPLYSKTKAASTTRCKPNIICKKKNLIEVKRKKKVYYSAELNRYQEYNKLET